MDHAAIVSAKACPYCSGGTVLKKSSTHIYFGRDYGPVWQCISYPTCDAYVGCHKNTEIPLGRLANADLRRAKNAAHRIFDDLWRRKIRREQCSKTSARASAYKWLSAQMGTPPEFTHIGMFDIEQCRRVVQICRPYSNGDRAPQRAA
jgi:hypothetical protein